MSKFMVKPIEVEAFQFDGKNHDECIQWLDDLGVEAHWGINLNHDSWHLLILEGAPERDLFVPTGNWVIRDERGLVYTVSNYFFEPRYSVKEQIMSKHPSKKKSKRLPLGDDLPPKKRKIV